jgi:hypothetical protein
VNKDDGLCGHNYFPEPPFWTALMIAAGKSCSQLSVPA